MHNIGVSSSYFAAHGLGIYDSVKAASELGFSLIEMGAAHNPEHGLIRTIRKIKRDFPEIDFSKSLMVGDSHSDIEFGLGLGMKTVFIGLVTGIALFGLTMSNAVAGQVPAEGGLLPEIRLEAKDPVHQQYLGVKGSFVLHKLKAEVVIVEIFSMY